MHNACVPRRSAVIVVAAVAVAGAGLWYAITGRWAGLTVSGTSLLALLACAVPCTIPLVIARLLARRRHHQATPDR